MTAPARPADVPRGPVAARPDPGDAARQVARDSLVGSLWTLVSRVSGLARVVVVAAVLGPTQFANLYQSANVLPNLTFELLTGALVGSLVVPALVRHLDRGDRTAADRLASGFLTAAVLAGVAVAAAAVAAGPLLLDLLTAGVPDGQSAATPGAAWLLLALLLAQVPLYTLAAVGAAAQNARGRFALAAAAPTVENAGIVAALAAYAWLLASGRAGAQGDVPAVLVLGGGTTAAVALHAGLQWWGARRAGVRLGWAAGWRDPEVRALVRLAVPGLGTAGLNVARHLCLLVVAAAVPGGVLALTLALAFYNLPVALAARPAAQAALPGLARAHHDGDGREFGASLDRSLGLVLFLTVPAAVGCALLAGPLAHAVSFGAMADPAARELVRASLLGVSLGVVGEAVLVLGTQASYARRDAVTPLQAVVLRTAVSVLVMLAALSLLDGPALLLAVGAAVAAGDLLAAVFLVGGLWRRLPHPPRRALRRLGRTGAATAAMAPPVLLVGGLVGPDADQVVAAAAVATAGLLGLATYLGVQRLLGADDLAGVVRVPGRSR